MPVLMKSLYFDLKDRPQLCSKAASTVTQEVHVNMGMALTHACVRVFVCACHVCFIQPCDAKSSAWALNNNHPLIRWFTETISLL